MMMEKILKTKLILQNQKNQIQIKRTRNMVKPTKRVSNLLKKEINQYFDSNGYLSWSYSKKKYIVLGTNSPKNGIVECPQCHTGQLMVIRSRLSGKRFLGCSNFHNGCKASSPLLQRAKLRTTKRKCEYCLWPIILFRYSRKQKWTYRCSNILCSSRQITI
jgi:ssDNA-binding Zn-finger/Zn-ribbon topoisomerase 1